MRSLQVSISFIFRVMNNFLANKISNFILPSFLQHEFTLYMRMQVLTLSIGSSVQRDLITNGKDR
jgi:hypothetical protein